MSLKRSILYSQFLTQKNTHWIQIFIGGTNTYVFFLYLEGISHDIVLHKAWMKTNKVTREQQLSPTKNNKDTDTPLMFITAYSSANPNFKDFFPNIDPI